MKVIVWIGSMNGVALHRLIIPYETLHQNHPDIEVEFLSAGNTAEEVINKAKKADLFVFNRTMPIELLDDIKGKVRIVCDNDDYWMLSNSHPLYYQYLYRQTPERIVRCMLKADTLTSSTDALARQMEKTLKRGDVKVFPNALKGVGQFTRVEPTPSPRIRLGIIGSASHHEDMELLDGINHYIPDDVKQRIQWVLCGFDKGMQTTWSRDGKEMGSEQAPWDTVCWTRWERNLTNDYSLIPTSHTMFLRSFVRTDYDTDDYYRRVWARRVNVYASLCDEIDVLVTPLTNSYFNTFKSQLKMVEASVKGKGLIISNVRPYTDDIIPLIERGGGINPEGNCIAVDGNRGVKGFAKAVCAIARDPELITTMRGNLSRLTDEGGKYNLDKVTEDRYKWITSLR